MIQEDVVEFDGEAQFKKHNHEENILYIVLIYAMQGRF
jgi:hypothetical protein